MPGLGCIEQARACSVRAQKPSFACALWRLKIHDFDRNPGISLTLSCILICQILETWLICLQSEHPGGWPSKPCSDGLCSIMRRARQHLKVSIP